MKINLPEFEIRSNDGRIKKFLHPSGKYIGWNYTDKCQYKKAWDEFTIQARGIITLEDGTVISRPFTKFFNLGEAEAEPIPWNESVEITEKVDGSLIIVSFYNGEMIVNSRGSFTSEHAEFAKNWLMQHDKNWFIKHMLFLSERQDYYIPRTWLFEAVFPETNNSKIINYGDKADLTLLAVIENESGKEWDYEQLIYISSLVKIPITPKYNFDDIHTIIDKCKVRKIEEGEGLVIHFLESGKRIKVKSDEYIRLHRLISHTSPKHVLEALMKGDDIESICSSLPDELYTEVKTWVSNFQKEYTRIQDLAIKVKEELEDITGRKWKSLHVMENLEYKEIQGVIFSMMDGKTDLNKQIWGAVKRKFDSKEMKMNMADECPTSGKRCLFREGGGK